ncbi:MAG: single-stranded DNA-binding protein [Myxococcota bacterium]
MAEGLNRVMLLGNLGQDPELRYTQSGSAVLNLRLATAESFVDRDGNRQERTDWHNVVVWGKRAEGLSKFLRKGSSIFVEGSLRTSSFEGRDGQKRWKTEVNARNILLTGGRRDDGPGAGYGGASAGGGYGGNVVADPNRGAGGVTPPNPGGGGGGGGGGPAFESPPDAFGPEDDDDDIPF